MRKLFFIIVIIILAYFVFARNVHFNPFIHGSKKSVSTANVKVELTHDNFLTSLPALDNTIRLGGGNVVMYFDTLQKKVLLQSYFLNKKNTLQMDKDHFQSIIDLKGNPKYIADCPFPYENIEGNARNYCSFNFDRGFYLGIYRELLENISLWEEKYGNLIVSFGAVTNPESNQEMVLISVKANIKNQLNNVIYLLPNLKTDKHLYNFMLTDKSVIKEPYLKLLNSIGYSLQPANTLQKTWKIHPKKYELRTLKWNFD